MKCKLPKGFKLSKNVECDDLYIYDEVKDQWACSIKSIPEALELISRYTVNLNLIKETKLPEHYEITTGGINDSFTLYYKDNFIKQSKNITDLIKIAAKTTELDLQLKALNEGEEIEL